MKRFVGVLLALVAIVLLLYAFWPANGGSEGEQALFAEQAPPLPETSAPEAMEDARPDRAVVEPVFVGPSPHPRVGVRVETEQGAPAVGATVSAIWEGGEGEWVTDEAGRIAAVELVAFPVTWEARLGAQAVRSGLARWPESGELVMRLPPADVLHGRVFREDGEYVGRALTEVAVSLWREADSAQPFARTWADTEGYFSFPLVEFEEGFVIHAGGSGFVDRGPRELVENDWSEEGVDVPLNYLLGYKLPEFPADPSWSRCVQEIQGDWNLTMRADFGHPESTSQQASFSAFSPPWHFRSLLPKYRGLLAQRAFLEAEVGESRLVSLFSSRMLDPGVVRPRFRRGRETVYDIVLHLSHVVDAFPAVDLPFAGADEVAPGGFVEVHVSPPARADLIQDEQPIGSLQLIALELSRGEPTDRRDEFELPLFGRDLRGLRVDCIPTGSYHARIRLESGVMWPRQGAPNAPGLSEHGLPVVRVTESGVDWHLDLSELAVVEVSFVDERGEPATGVHRVQLGRGERPETGTGVWYVSGNWNVEGHQGRALGLPPGKYWIGSSPRSMLDFREASVDIEVQPGQDLVTVELQAQDPKAKSGEGPIQTIGFGTQTGTSTFKLDLGVSIGASSKDDGSEK